jgi:Phosphotransferase enzyme family
MTRERSAAAEPWTAGPSGDPLIAEAAALGLVSRREVREGSVGVRSASPDGAVRALVVHEHVISYAKPRSGHPADERVLATRLAALDLGPRSHGDLPTVWMSALPGSPLDQVNAGVSDLADLAQAWGLAVAQLHSERIGGVATPAPRPWVFGVEPRPPRIGNRLSAAAGAVLRTATYDPILRRAARQADDRWTESTWIHGDLCAEHVIVQNRPHVRARFVGLGRAGVGDPSWDVACAVETIVRHAPRWRTSERVLIDYFLRGYRRGNGPGHLDPELRALRAIEIAWQLALAEDALPAPRSGQADRADDEQVRSWLARARSYAAHSAHSGQSRWAA